MVFLVPWDNLILFQKFLHGLCLFSVCHIFYGLLHFRRVQTALLDGEDAETGRVLELAPEIFDEVLEDVRIAVNLQEGVAVPLVGVHRLELAVLPDFRHRLQEQLHLVEDEDDVAHLGVLGDRRFRGFFPCVFLCHN